MGASVRLPQTARQVMIRDIKASQSWDNAGSHFDNSQNITIILLYVGNAPDQTPGYVDVDIGSAQGCPNTNISFSAATLMVTVGSPPGGIIVAANFTDPWGILYVKPGQGNPSDVDVYTEPVPLIAGARISVILTNTQRMIFSNSAVDILGFVTTPDPSARNYTDTAVLRLRPRTDLGYPTRSVEDFTDSSVLAGFATLGGFWTFTNGVFAMFFGANLLYFLFRRRPLSALGIVHIFQRRALMRKWNEDFPALYTEGGRPGSESAGIVAFIRERLVDLEEKEAKAMDPEAPSDAAGTEQPGVIVEGDNQYESGRDSPSENDQIRGPSALSDSRVSDSAGEGDGTEPAQLERIPRLMNLEEKEAKAMDPEAPSDAAGTEPGVIMEGDNQYESDRDSPSENNQMIRGPSALSDGRVSDSAGEGDGAEPGQLECIPLKSVAQSAVL
ncbi:hypothetical protein C8R44DRAFT_745795 [Mycena epipterygia]|nr:hypothetical protein C8R44DRAFT_745795 [Mycena epipterygia]